MGQPRHAHIVVGCFGGFVLRIYANREYSSVFVEEEPMANREQRGNKEKKKPKTDKKAAPVSVRAPAYVEPQLVRKPHKGKQDW